MLKTEFMRITTEIGYIFVPIYEDLPLFINIGRFFILVDRFYIFESAL